uniref:peptidoglycan D,D-transpeptidase FtsI family protein n=1 Tax=Acetatifactor sp. TaxID=1872090 RepID=UPI004056C72A
MQTSNDKIIKEETAAKIIKKKRLGNRREIMFSMFFFVAIFLGMIGYLTHFVATNEQDMINNSYNSRQEILLSRNYRGDIFSRDGEILAQTILDAEQNEEREYPFGKLFSHIVGYSTKGRMGVEAMANYYLINTNTSITNKVANDMAGVKNPGDDVYTTLDVQIQQMAEEQLDIYRGAIVVTEVKTGKVLAMVSHPNFDPNEIEEIWDDLLNNDSSSVLLNRATQGLYPPGSTFKVVTALEYIRENPDTYSDYSFQCNGFYQEDDSRINCIYGTNHGAVSFERSLVKSCNASFANIGMTLDREAFAETLEDLLFGEELPLTLNYSRSSVRVSEEMTTDEMMQTSIGQGKTLITPMHLNMITCAIANDGVLMKPYVIDRVVNDAGNVVKTFKSNSYGRMMSEEEALILQQLMAAVVEKGTATKLNELDYTVAGKTGSAEYNNNKGDSHAWFTGFAPAEDPEVCITIIVEGAGNGGEYAVPIARRMFEVYFNEK